MASEAGDWKAISPRETPSVCLLQPPPSHCSTLFLILLPSSTLSHSTVRETCLLPKMREGDCDSKGFILMIQIYYRTWPKLLSKNVGYWIEGDCERCPRASSRLCLQYLPSLFLPIRFSLSHQLRSSETNTGLAPARNLPFSTLIYYIQRENWICLDLNKFIQMELILIALEIIMPKYIPCDPHKLSSYNIIHLIRILVVEILK